MAVDAFKVELVDPGGSVEVVVQFSFFGVWDEGNQSFP